ncbi:VOC family protein [Mobilicoccus massiliensis]|uniref:VOC family protein n=1 Tax=Mobilicoccus massiliensis TaxID=1522310 RepID=UPI00058FC95D|nr:VOC family protein [Mobilicoccus massiliensis]
MPTASWFHMFIDVPRTNLPAATDFWSTVTGWRAEGPDGDRGQFVELLPESGDDWVWLQGVGREDGGVHLDLDCEDPAAALDPVLALGAVRVGPSEDVEVMRSPGGLTFCLATAGDRSHLERNAESVLDQVCIDIPEQSWEAEVAFWSAVVGREVEAGDRPEFARLVGPDDAPRILLQRLAADDGPVRAHPDFAVADRPEQTARHLAAGAELLVEFDWWTVLLAPGGQVYCLTDRDPATGAVRGMANRDHAR